VDGSPASDARLVEAALGGDKDAFAALVTRHWATAVALAARVLGTPDLASDAAQEAAVAALVGLDRLRTPGRFGAWFCGITLNVARGRLPIWVGPTEATVLALSLQAVETPRPLTYQMTASLLDACGSRVSEVRITRLAGEVFYAVVIVDGPAGRREVDARPSDAVNLALVTGAPILADSALLDDPGAGRRDEWQDLPSGTATLAAEARVWMRRFAPTASQHVGPGGQGQVQK
jgi:bifunctional DNase/RNase